jgi:hypothetical protein
VLAALLVEQRASNWRSIEERERFWAEEAKLVARWFFIAAGLPLHRARNDSTYFLRRIKLSGASSIAVLLRVRRACRRWEGPCGSYFSFGAIPCEVN